MDGTIVAVATAMGESAIGVIRVSGPEAGALVDPRTGERLDEALCVVMRGPRSYTGDDVAEISCHGSAALLRLVSRLVAERGARLAAPGEFTRRAPSAAASPNRCGRCARPSST